MTAPDRSVTALLGGPHTRTLRLLVFAIVTVAAVAVTLAAPRVAQDPAYHLFADRRPLFGIPNAANVLSNLAFLAAGLLGLRALGGVAAFLDARERAPWAVLFGGVVLTSVGSAVYHLSPANASLAVDRLAMTVGFMGLLSTMIAERFDVRLGVRLLVPLLVIGAATVLWWYGTELRGSGDLRPYLAVQGYPLAAIPLLLVLGRARYTGSSWLLGGLGLYAAAKLAEVYDAAIFAATGGVVSGHTLKHLLAALGIGALALMLSRRRPLGCPSDTVNAAGRWSPGGTSTLAVAALLLAGGACVPSRDTTHDACPGEIPAIASDGAAHALKTVFLIVLENEDWASIEGSSSAPYINGALLPRFAHTVNYRNGGLHPSLGNYITLEAGDPLGIHFDTPPDDVPLAVTCHLVTYLEQTGLTWKAYAEDIPPGLCPTYDVRGYAVRHDPFVYFEDVAGNPPDLSSARCILHVRPYAELAQDLRTGAVARYNFIVPNLCDSGHDSCPPLHDRIRQEDAFLARELPVLMASPAYQDGGLILITWDEGAGGDEPIGLIAVSPFAKPGYRGDLAYSHASTLRTIEEIFALTPLLRGAATAASLADLFTAYP